MNTIADRRKMREALHNLYAEEFEGVSNQLVNLVQYHTTDYCIVVIYYDNLFGLNFHNSQDPCELIDRTNLVYFNSVHEIIEYLFENYPTKKDRRDKRIDDILKTF